DEHGRVIVGEAPDTPGRDRTDHGVWIWSLRFGAIVAMIGFLGTVVTGDVQGKLMYEQQPMKMAAAEAACHSGSSFSVLSLGDPGSTDCRDVTTLIEVPGVLGFLGAGEWGADMPGIRDLEPEYVDRYGERLPDDALSGDRAGAEIDYVPVMWVTYWGFRLMIGLGGIVAAAGAVALWLTRRGTVPRSAGLMRLALVGILAPFAANIAGWIFTEMGRQPFVVAPNPDATGADSVFMYTQAAVSPGVTAGELLFSLISLGSIYGVLLVVELYLLVRFTRGGVASAMPELAGRDDDADDPDAEHDAGRAFPHCPPRRGTRNSRGNAGHCLVCRHRAPVDRIPPARGVRPGRGHAHDLLDPQRTRPARHAQHHRPRLGRQRGVAHHRRRRDVRRLLALVRRPAVGPLRAADPRAARADRPGRWHRVPRQGRHPRLGDVLDVHDRPGVRDGRVPHGRHARPHLPRAAHRRQRRPRRRPL